MALGGALWAQGPDVRLDPGSSFQVNLPANGPLAVASANWDQSKATARGGALQVDLHSTLHLKNVGQQRIRGVALLVMAQEVTPGGKGAVTVPSLDIAPGETFPVRVDLRLMRPLSRGAGALVEVRLDGVLFDDLTFYGPDKLNSRRSMLVWELEARRDRRKLLEALQSGGPERVQQELVAALSRQAQQPRVDLHMARAGRATNSDAGRELEFAFVQMPDAPLEFISGAAIVDRNEARMPRISVTNRSRKPVRFFEIGWLVRDTQGRQYAAGAAPAELVLQPGARGDLAKENVLRFTRPLPGQGSEALAIAGLSAYVNSVEFSDGAVWVPERNAPAESGEMQRLTELYRKRGLDAVLGQLRRLR